MCWASRYMDRNRRASRGCSSENNYDENVADSLEVNHRSLFYLWRRRHAKNKKHICVLAYAMRHILDNAAFGKVDVFRNR